MSGAHEPGASVGTSKVQPMSSPQYRKNGEVLLAYNLKGHRTLSKKAIDKILDELPKELAWMRRLLKGTPQRTVDRDVADVIYLWHWRKSGQKHHFMRDKSQSQAQAYELGVRWIHDNGFKAAKNLGAIVKRPDRGGGKVNAADWYVNVPLGNAFHALQDSFAEAHTSRTLVGLRYVITAIHVYDDHNKDARKGWEGHGALDEKWDSPLGATAMLGCQVLTRNVIAASQHDSPMQIRSAWNESWSTFKANFLAMTAMV